MKEMQFKIEIKAPRERVWDILWQDKTFREWADLVDPGTYMVGELKEGNEVHFNSAGGYGVKSFIAKLVPNEYILFRHKADTRDNGENDREEQWAGGKESYSLVHKEGVTTLAMTFDVPPELEEIMNSNYPKALARVKRLSERLR